MQPQPPQAPSATALYALDFSRRFGLLITLLGAVIARRFREPQLAGLTVPLWNRVNRLGRRFQRLLARLAAGRPSPRHPVIASLGSEAKQSPPAPPRQPTRSPRRPAPSSPHRARLAGPRPRSRGRRLRLPTGAPARRGRSRRPPGPASPAQRILNPLRRLLGIAPFAIRQRPVRPQPAPPAPPEAFEPLGEIVSRSPRYTWSSAPPHPRNEPDQAEPTEEAGEVEGGGGTGAITVATV